MYRQSSIFVIKRKSLPIIWILLISCRCKFSPPRHLSYRHYLSLSPLSTSHITHHTIITLTSPSSIQHSPTILPQKEAGQTSPELPFGPQARPTNKTTMIGMKVISTNTKGEISNQHPKPRNTQTNTCCRWCYLHSLSILPIICPNTV